MNHEMDTEDGMVVARVVIERVLDEDGGDAVSVIAYDREGNLPPLIELLGMIELGRDTVYRMAIEQDNEATPPEGEE